MLENSTEKQQQVQTNITDYDSMFQPNFIEQIELTRINRLLTYLILATTSNNGQWKEQHFCIKRRVGSFSNKNNQGSKKKGAIKMRGEGF